MKFLIILATLLLVPIVMKFQRQAVEQDASGRQTGLVLEVLERHGVIEPEAAVDFLDVSISGFVESEEVSENITQEVNALRGLRLVESHLRIQGWFEVVREKEQVSAKGLVPLSWTQELLKEQSQVEQSEVREKESTIMTGTHPAAWGLLLDDLLAQPGDRSLSQRGTKCILGGEATPRLASEWIAQVKEILPKGVTVQNEFSLYPSTYHFPSREIESDLGGESLRSVRRTLADSLLAFSAEKTVLTSKSEALLDEIVALILENQESAHFVIGGYPDESGSALARQRAEAVHKKLLAKGAPVRGLTVEPFEMTEDDSKGYGHVEVLVR